MQPTDWDGGVSAEAHPLSSTATTITAVALQRSTAVSFTSEARKPFRIPVWCGTTVVNQPNDK